MCTFFRVAGRVRSVAQTTDNPRMCEVLVQKLGRKEVAEEYGFVGIVGHGYWGWGCGGSCGQHDDMFQKEGGRLENCFSR